MPIGNYAVRIDGTAVKEPITYRVAPDKTLERWSVLLDGKQGKKAVREKGLSREKAVKQAFKLAQRKQGPVLLLIHKTRSIVDQCLQVGH